MLRWILISDATVAVKYPGKLKRYYMRLKKRIGHGRAIVASAHKLVKIIFHMLKENRHYEERDDDLLYSLQITFRLCAVLRIFCSIFTFSLPLG